MDSFWKWLTQFDVIKGVILAIAVMVSSWYDLKAEVRLANSSVQSVRTEVQQRWTAQEHRDIQQDEQAKHYREDVKEALNDIKSELRQQRRERLGK